MKNIIIFLTAFFGITFSASAFDIIINVSGIDTKDGVLMIGLYDNAEKFPISGKEIKGVKVKTITKDQMQVTIKDVEKGNYAIAVWHDENSNGKLDTNLFGAPSENYGFSNNEYGIFGPPDFDEVSFKVERDTTINITIE